MTTALVLSSVDKKTTLSYQDLWSRAFDSDSSTWKISNINVHQVNKPPIKIRFTDFDVVVLTSSIFSNTNRLPAPWIEYLSKSTAFLTYIVGNEYKLIPEKKLFCKTIGTNLVLSMLIAESIPRAYPDGFGGAHVEPWMFAALDPKLFPPGVDLKERPIRFGYRCQSAPMYVGHREREDIMLHFQSGLFGPLSSRDDLSMDPKDRLDTAGWVQFLQNCQITIGTEAGTDFYDPTDSLRLKVNSMFNENNDISFQEIFDRVFKNVTNPINGRNTSSRHFEALGTQTPQVLYEGYYSGLLEPWKDYIPLKKDLSNVSEVTNAINDLEGCRQLAQSAYKRALEHHTYEHRIRELVALVNKYK